MTMTEPYTIVGVFRDRNLAKQAIDELRRAGFRDDQIRVIGHDSGSILTGLRNIFSEPRTVGDASSDNLVGVPQEDIPYYQHELEAGYTIVVVQGYAHQQQASDILHQYGSYNAAHRPLEMGGSRAIPVRKEELQVHKEMVQTGEIRIHKRVITEEKTFTVPVTREELTIERVPHSDRVEGTPVHINDEKLVVERRPVASETADAQTFGDEVLRDGGTLRIVLREEQVTIQKQPVVVEEVIIHKHLVQETRHLEEPAKREEVHIERVGDAIIHGDGF